MRWLKTALLVIGVAFFLLAAAFVLGGLLIPDGQSFENDIEINASAEEVWQVIADKERYTSWQTSIEKVEKIDDKNWIEYPRNVPEPLRFNLAKDERPTSMEFQYTMGDSFAGQWKGEITPTATGVRLKTTDSYSTRGWPTKIMIYIFLDLNSFAMDWNVKLKERVETLSK